MHIDSDDCPDWVETARSLTVATVFVDSPPGDDALRFMKYLCERVSTCWLRSVEHWDDQDERINSEWDVDSVHRMEWVFRGYLDERKVREVKKALHEACTRHRLAFGWGEVHGEM